MIIIEWINNFKWPERCLIYFTIILFCFATYNHFKHGKPLNIFFDRWDDFISKIKKRQ